MENQNKNGVAVRQALVASEKTNSIRCNEAAECYVMYGDGLNVVVDSSRKMTEEIFVNEIFSYSEEKEGEVYHGKITIRRGEQEFAHRHDFYELLYIAEGASKQVVMDDTILLRQSDLLLINPNTIHSEIMEEERTAYYFQLKGEVLREILRDGNLSRDMKRFFEPQAGGKRMEYYHFSGRDNQLIKELMDWAVKERVEERAGSRLIVRGILARVLKELDSGKQNRAKLESKELRRKTNVIKNLEQYLKDNRWNVKNGELAKHFHYSEAYLGQLVKENTGVPLGQYCVEHRLEYARQLLCETKLSVNEIVEKLGYQNKTYFYRKFKQRYNVTPQEYRKNIQNGYSVTGNP